MAVCMHCNAELLKFEAADISTWMQGFNELKESRKAAVDN